MVTVLIWRGRGSDLACDKVSIRYDGGVSVMHDRFWCDVQYRMWCSVVVLVGYSKLCGRSGGVVW